LPTRGWQSVAGTDYRQFAVELAVELAAAASPWTCTHMRRIVQCVGHETPRYAA
jgi:hypothetical protein